MSRSDAVAQLLAAELAVADDAKPGRYRATHAPRVDGGRSPRLVPLPPPYPQDRVRERRELVGKRHDRKLILDVGDGEAKHVALLEVAQVIEQALEVRPQIGALGP